ncbi:MAG: PilZ domain-containing protein, partial [Novosphingobium sp.]|nr:PilZ domain-containing protein [Novosphingobium sp.]
GKHRYNGTIRNISTTGAMIEGLWNVPEGTEFSIHLSPGYVVKAQTRWCKEDRMGVEFAVALEHDENGGISLMPPQRRGETKVSLPMRKAS